MDTAFADALGVSGTWNPQTKIMSRYIDRQPVHPNPRPMKVILLSFGRNATLGFYYALKILGYKPYHQLEVFKNGVPHVRMMNDAVRASSQGIGRPFTLEDFDKFLGDFDAITDIPAWFLEDLVAAYPDAKFVLTERDPEAWRKSVAKTFQPLGEFWLSPMIRLVGLFDSYTYYISKLTYSFVYVLYGGYLGPDKQKAQREAVKVYERHNTMVKKLIPADKLLVIKLEEGLGWDKICPFLGHDIPDVPYPRVNEAAEFQVMVMKDMIASWKKTALKVGVFLVPLVGASIWLLRRS
ncbi:nad dependent epimerase [Colletotrichum scovillei]|uniref:Nad dependent epimerase n=2 Tax=Colletotrichum scovillei TaxID=1209932 RepID=A0A9P7U8C9_9PEZI|nr:nad dependent epimerase [Colletotrichum scovillei]KAG7046325.1 nad dependent epimerase [Colletotrichum scovillei]KAG7063636.1 nad dependent epimerase [Colletotrichum scovillei]